MTETKLNIEIPINKLIERYVQQACISNLLVTVFAALRLYTSLIIEKLNPLYNFFYGSQPAKN